MIGDHLNERDRPDRAKAERAREGEKTKRAGDELIFGRDAGALAQGWNVPAFFEGELLKPLFMFSPLLPPRQFFATASTAEAVSLARKFSRSRACSRTQSRNVSMLSARIAFSRE